MTGRPRATSWTGGWRGSGLGYSLGMDSLTQFVLGAAVTRGVVGARARRAAPLIGGVVATLPDLDVFIPLGGTVEDFTYHRSASHSLLVLTLLAPAVAWLVHRLLRPPGVSYRRWLAAVWLTLITHPLLDALTVYGTQLLWPLTEWPFGLASVFIIDPVYTLLLLAGLLTAMWVRDPHRAGRANHIGLTLSTAYLAFGVLAQTHVYRFAEASLDRQGAAHERVLAIAAPFSSLAWRIVVMSGDSYQVAYHSLLAPAPELRLTRFPRTPALLDPVRERWEIDRLRWFTKGFYGVDEVNGEIRLTDLRMGIEPDRYAFSFVVATHASPIVAAEPVTRVEPRRFRDGDLASILAVLRGAPSL